MLAVNPDLITVLALAFVVALVWCVGRVMRRWDFVISVDGGRVVCEGGLPETKHREIARYLLDDLLVTGNVKIMGKRFRGRLVLCFRGRLTPGHKQRIRNYLLTHL